jgi:Fe-S-cluster containining protein
MATALDTDEFIALYCRWVPAGIIECLSLKELANYDCVFWKNGCSVYNVRPLQCRSFPFWESILDSPSTWKAVAKTCPGMGAGTWHPAYEIEAWIQQRRTEVLIERKCLL